ncbi:unnamed protein product [Dibothriocephalus latus]|uniref:DNA mismatch repair protein MutS-like N-terminal domain-containing protein n=1 Tax=Dibothriocephalus latus TaxID=60516 RepID=A0A3P6QMT3_DIBLA|nr:unnamed protein product [Dibothriocephalus latus]
MSCVLSGTVIRDVGPSEEKSDDLVKPVVIYRRFSVVEDDESPLPKVKRRRLVLESSDEEENASPPSSPVRRVKTTDSPLNSRTLNISRSFSRDSPKTSASLCTSFDEETPKGKGYDAETLLLDMSGRNDSIALDETIEGAFDGNWPHLSLPFLQPDRIKDINGHRPNHPDYDPRTLFVPDDYIKAQTPGLRQWWQLKSRNADTIIFFKVGKFYELYHQDAVTAAEELRLSYMKGKFAHTGFPESAFEKMANQLLHKGLSDVPSMITLLNIACVSLSKMTFDELGLRKRQL